MVKVFGAPESNLEKKLRKRISVRVPKKMLSDFNSALERDGYTQRKRSEWVNSALHSLLSNPYYLDIVSEEWIERGDSNQLTLLIEGYNIEVLKKAMNRYRETFQTERLDLQSKFIRSAIIQKIINL